MEYVDIIVVMGIISMLFKGKKPEGSTKDAKETADGADRSQTPMRKLKEMSQEMYKELQREFQTEIDEPPSRQSSERTPAPVVTLPAQKQKPERRETSRPVPVREEKAQTRTSNREPHRGRLSVHQGSLVTQKPVEHNEYDSANSAGLDQGNHFL